MKEHKIRRRWILSAAMCLLLTGCAQQSDDNLYRLPELPRENRQPASPAGNQAPGVPPPPIKDPLGGKTAIARFS